MRALVRCLANGVFERASQRSTKLELMVKRWAGQIPRMKMIGGDKILFAHTLAICTIAWRECLDLAS